MRERERERFIESDGNKCCLLATGRGASTPVYNSQLTVDSRGLLVKLVYEFLHVEYW